MKALVNALSVAMLILLTLFVGFASFSATSTPGQPLTITDPPPIDPLTRTVYLPIVTRPANTIEISQLQYSGSDEYIEIANNGPGVQNLDGWVIRSTTGSQTYTFGSINLGIGQSVRVHSGPGAFSNPPFDLLWSTAYLWNNAGDEAELYDNENVLRDSLCYSDGC